MNLLIFGASGMVGQGVLRASLAASDVAAVTVIGRQPLGMQHAKLREIIVGDLFRAGALLQGLRGFDACFFSIGVSSAGMSETAYRRLTFDLALCIAEPLARHNPQMRFVFVSGAGTDSTELGNSMWARVKGATENALRDLPFRQSLAFRPGLIRPLDGIRSKTPIYRLALAVLGPLLPLMQWLFPRLVLDTTQIGLAFLQVARAGAAQPILEINDIAQLAALAEAAANSKAPAPVQPGNCERILNRF